MINLPEELKSRISIEDVVARYWEEPNRAHRVKCFAHNGKDRNMLVKNGFVYCFVCSARFDIIGVVQHLFGLSFIQACEKLNSDCFINTDFDNECSLCRSATALHKAGYRKQSETVKEFKR